jgi:hypothetical protein
MSNPLYQRHHVLIAVQTECLPSLFRARLGDCEFDRTPLIAASSSVGLNGLGRLATAPSLVAM